MAFIQTESKRYIHFDIVVSVPYDNVEGNVRFFLRKVPVMKRTESAPEEGGNWETVYIKGFPFKDGMDFPSLEKEAFILADEFTSW